MRLSAHFTLDELTSSSTAERLRINNQPPPELLPPLIRVAEMLERIRTLLGVPITITSGYRSQALNEAVRGVKNSDHIFGHAADILAPAFGTSYQVAARLAPLVAELGIGQLLFEGVAGKRWVHVSTHMPSMLTNRILTISDAGAQVGIQNLA